MRSYTQTHQHTQTQEVEHCVHMWKYTYMHTHKHTHTHTHTQIENVFAHVEASLIVTDSSRVAARANTQMASPPAGTANQQQPSELVAAEQEELIGRIAAVAAPGGVTVMQGTQTHIPTQAETNTMSHSVSLF